MIRIWFKDGNYMDVPRGEAHRYHNQPDYDRSEDLDKEVDEYSEGE